MSDHVVAVLCSDIHLSQRSPVARSAEPCWFRAMQRPLDEIRELRGQYSCPLIIAGDIFDHWRSPPSLINWAIKNLPQCLGIPGQHDLPCHNYADIQNSAYWTLVEANIVDDLPGGDEGPFVFNGLFVSSFPWGFEIKPRLVNPSVGKQSRIHLAVIHAYCCRPGSDYPGAPEDSYVTAWKDRLRGYDAAVVGDNHIGFLTKCGDCNLLNSGGLMRRKRDEIDYKPSVGLLLETGEIKRHFLDCSEDKFTDEALRQDEDDKSSIAGLEEFVKELKTLEAESLDFRQAVRQYVGDNKLSEGSKKLLLTAIEG